MEAEDDVFRQSQLRKHLEQRAEGLGCTRELMAYLNRLESRIIQLECDLSIAKEE